MRLLVCWRSGEEPEIKRVSSGGASAPPFLEGGQTMNYTYIVQCSDGTLYTGWTNDLDKRIKAHNDGKGAKYTKPRLPVELVYAKGHATKEEAMKDEYRIKQLSRKRKQELCKEYEEEQRELQEEHPEQAVSSEEKSPGVLKDKDIREPLFEFLEETYGKVRILEEKTMGRSRADLVMVAPECLYGIEIKSAGLLGHCYGGADEWKSRLLFPAASEGESEAEMGEEDADSVASGACHNSGVVSHAEVQGKEQAVCGGQDSGTCPGKDSGGDIKQTNQ